MCTVALQDSLDGGASGSLPPYSTGASSGEASQLQQASQELSEGTSSGLLGDDLPAGLPVLLQTLPNPPRLLASSRAPHTTSTSPQHPNANV